ncbi:hypothetical protein [Pontibacter sp. H249]|uniref:hypothetical protein n=1 Tax=Pontibacter sp. H249 TaxID=3133420 RepID=UPI0030C3CF61
MNQMSVLAAAAALTEPAVKLAASSQHPARPNAPPGYTLRAHCNNRGRTTGELHKFLPALRKAYTEQQNCTNC